MTRATLNHYRERLEQMLKRLGSDRELLTSEGLGAIDRECVIGEPSPLDSVDRGQSAELDVTLALLAREEQRMTEVEEALERLDDGTFGFCEACGHAIAQPRLQTLPYARYCIRCALMKTN